MTKRWSIAEARSNLPNLVREAESGRPVELTRRGEPVAVLVGRRDYERLAASRRSFSAAYAAFTRRVDLKELAIDPDEIFGGPRRGAPGREVDL